MENQTRTKRGPKVNHPQGVQPNIIMIMVDQMRFPMHFPPGIGDADQFVEKYMPNLFNHIWSKGVRFGNHYIAASDCTAGRATMYTGLYAYQTYLMLTLITFPEPPKGVLDDGTEQKGLLQPQLQAAFPTIGRLLREAGYDTPYFGKWHLSYHCNDLERYGFDSHVPPQDLPGMYGQGLEWDDTMARDAANWVNERVTSNNRKPFFLSVNFVNPHDKQWFWGGTEVVPFNQIFETLSEKPAQTYKLPPTPEDTPPSYGYPADVREFLNWESKSQLEAKPGAHTLVKEVFQYQMGGIYDPEEADSYTPVLEPKTYWTAPTPLQPNKHKAIAPFAYWSKALDSYIQVMQMVDESIGTFMESLPEEVRESSVFIFTSDHGEYASSHGLQGKGGTIYEEGILVPFVVADPTGRFTSSPERYRTQMTSSVDLLPMIVSMGYQGFSDWMHESKDYEQLYGSRLDLLSILRDPDAPGRPYVFHTTDEFVPSSVNNINNFEAPLHVIGTIFQDQEGNKQKLGVYAFWEDLTPAQTQAVVIKDGSTQLEYYDHSTAGGAQELESTPGSEMAQEAIQHFWGAYPDGPSLIFDEVMAPLPPAYQEAQQIAYRRLQEYMQILNTASEQGEAEAVEEIAPPDTVRERVTRLWAY